MPATALWKLVAENRELLASQLAEGEGVSVRVYYAGRSVEPAEVVTRDDGWVVLVLSVDDADDPRQVVFVQESAISHIDVLRKPRSTTSRAPIGFSVHREDE